LRRTRELADKLKVGVSIHVAEQVYEFHEALRRTGRTPVGILAENGFLGPDAVLGHCRFVGGNSQTAYPHDDDLDVLADSGATVAHAPLAGARRGGALESFQRFLDRGVRLSIGTDTYPLDVIAEMHAAALLCKVTDRNHEVARTADVFRAATLGGAKALGRTDLGRLAPGAKADIVIIDFRRLRVGPVYDPVRSLLHAATGEHVRTVIIDGVAVVEDGAVQSWDMREVAAEVRLSAKRIWSAFPDCHWSGQPVERVWPPAFKHWQPENATSTTPQTLP
jgi:cytosine/adenosine deaminase-related metal-dependent hydrolase